MRWLLPILCAGVAWGRPRWCGDSDCYLLRVELNGNAESLALGDLTFRASGTTSDGSHAQLAVKGRTLGTVEPWAGGAQFHVLSGMFPHLALGGLFGFFWGEADRSASPLPVRVDSGFSGIEVGPEIRAFVSGPWYEVQGGIALGLRYTSFCTELKNSCTRGADYAAKATSFDLFVQPRVALGLRHLDAANHLRHSVGVYVGGDLVPFAGVATGVYWAVSAPD